MSSNLWGGEEADETGLSDNVSGSGDIEPMSSDICREELTSGGAKGVANIEDTDEVFRNPLTFRDNKVRRIRNKA